MKKLLVGLMIFGTASAAQAGFYIEPYLGYNASKLEVEITNPNFSVSEAYTGALLGLRAGWKITSFWVAGDYQLANGQSGELGGESSTADITRLAAVGGMDLPLIPLNLFAGYVLSSTIGNDDASDFTGSGFKLGVGFTMLPFVNINVEYQTLTYDDEEKGLTSYADVKDTALVASVSLPWEF